MKAEQIALVRLSFDKLWPVSREFADLFYRRLFELLPEARPLFKADLEKQKTKLVSMIATIVGSVDQPVMFASIVEHLGKRHALFGVLPPYYGPVGDSLMWSLQQTLGTEFTSSTRDAWAALYDSVHRAMLRGAGSALGKDK